MIRSSTVELESIEKDLVIVTDVPKRLAPKPTEDFSNIPPDQISPADIDRAIGSSKIPQGDAKPPESARQAERARWMRLIETLGLKDDQAKSIEAAISENVPSPREGQQLDAAYEDAGAKLEVAILASLDEAQISEFREIEKRNWETRIESAATERFGKELAGLDLTAAQREQALQVLRTSVAEERSSIPGSARLLLSGSFLPVAGNALSEQAILNLRKLGEAVGIEEIAASHRADLERRMTLFEGILTPAQLQLQQAGVMESAENLDIISPRN